MKTPLLAIPFVAAFVVAAFPALAITVDFDGPFTALPYTEDGLTFSDLPGTSVSVAGGSTGVLVSGTNTIPIHIRAAGTQPFDLQQIQITQLTRTWRIESSSGEVLNIPGAGTLNFAGQPGWSNIIYFASIHNP